MDRDSEELQRSLLGLLQSLRSDAISESEKQENLPLDVANPSSSLDAPSAASSHLNFETLSDDRSSLRHFGDLPVVQDRFHALLKRRLEHEIQQNPPLFPWESEIHDYEADRAPVLLWLNQLKTLNLPVAVPESVLTHLLQRCQETLHSSLLEGAKLIRAVEELFPNQPQALNHLAGLVMASPARSGAIAPSTPEVNYPANYDAAAPMQQMVLSLLAAREILGTLTLTVSSVQPIVERQWLTELGLLTLQAEYEFGQLGSRLRLKGRLPIGGSLLLHGQGLEAIAHRSDAGVLSVELFDIQPNQPYVLEVQLTEHESTPLIFSVYAAEA